MFSSPASAGEPSGYDFQKEENAAKWKGVFVNSLPKVHISVARFFSVALSPRRSSSRSFPSPSLRLTPPLTFRFLVLYYTVSLSSFSPRHSCLSSSHFLFARTLDHFSSQWFCVEALDRSAIARPMSSLRVRTPYDFSNINSVNSDCANTIVDFFLNRILRLRYSLDLTGCQQYLYLAFYSIILYKRNEKIIMLIIIIRVSRNSIFHKSHQWLALKVLQVLYTCVKWYFILQLLFSHFFIWLYYVKYRNFIILN